MKNILQLINYINIVNLNILIEILQLINYINIVNLNILIGLKLVLD